MFFTIWHTQDKKVLEVLKIIENCKVIQKNEDPKWKIFKTPLWAHPFSMLPYSFLNLCEKQWLYELKMLKFLHVNVSV